MPNWKKTLDISEEWSQIKSDCRTHGESFCHTVSKKLKLILSSYSTQKDRDDVRELIDIFEYAADIFNDPDASLDDIYEEINYCMEVLYDFGDIGHRLWVKTF